MATKVEEAIAEIEERQATFAPEHEGLRDYAALNLHDESRTPVNESVLAYDHRRDLLNVAKAALEALMADGHPDIPAKEVTKAVFEDLQTNAATIEAALKKFRLAQASTLTIKPGTPEDQTPAKP